MKEKVFVTKKKLDSLICDTDIKNIVMADFERLGISNTTQRFQMFILKKDWIPVGDYPYPNLPEITYTCVLDKKKINALAGFRKQFKFPTVTYVHSS